jgi:ankyrin repeat protein
METSRQDRTPEPLVPHPDRGARERALLDAAGAGDLAAVRAALDADPALARARDAAGDSPLVVAAFRGHRAVASHVAEVVRAGEGLDAWEAALMGDLPRLRTLVDADPSLVRARRHDGWPLLHLAGFYGHPEVAAFLLDRGAEIGAISANHIANTALHATLAISGHMPLVELLVARGSDVNVVGDGGYTPLHIAASRGNMPAVELLLAHGADPGARTDDGQTAADIAAARGHDATAARLRSEG